MALLELNPYNSGGPPLKSVSSIWTQSSVDALPLNHTILVPPSYATATTTYAVKAVLVCVRAASFPHSGSPVHLRHQRPPVCESLEGLSGVCLEVQRDPDVSALLRRMNRELVDHHDSHTFSLPDTHTKPPQGPPYDHPHTLLTFFLEAHL